MSCIVQDYLRNGGTLDGLLTKYAINAKRHLKYPQLVQLKYDMIESPMGEALVQCCRGIILDEQDNWRVIAWPYDKFFNYGEGHAKPIDWATARVQEKLDGSLMILYHYRDEWHVATSGTPDAGGQVNGFGMTFADLFWKTWNAAGHLTDRFHKHLTYMFELMSPYNRVVVQHKDCRIVTIGIRDPATGKESVCPSRESVWEGYVPAVPDAVRSFPLQSIEEVTKTFETMSPLSQEGYVVVDGAFNRVKVKHPGYVAIHHMRDGFGPRRMLEVVRTGEHSELLAHFPEWRSAHDEIQVRYEALVGALEDAYAEHRGIEMQKEFALKVKDLPFSGALFMLRAGKTESVRKYLRDVNIKTLADYLDVRDVEF